MSTNLGLTITPRGERATVGPAATLGLALAIALGGCAMSQDEHRAGGAQMSTAGSCEQRHEEAIQACDQTFDPEAEQDELQACRARALDEFQACRGG